MFSQKTQKTYTDFFFDRNFFIDPYIVSGNESMELGRINAVQIDLKCASHRYVSSTREMTFLGNTIKLKQYRL